MKAKNTIPSWVAGALLALLAGSAQATLTLDPTNYDRISNDTSVLSGSDVAGLFGTSATLDLLYKAEVPGATGGAITEEGLFQDSYATQFGFVAGDDPTDPSSALLTYDGGSDPVIACPECYLVVKDGNASPSQYLYDLGYATNSGIWDGMETIEMTDFWPQSGAISNVAIWGERSEQEIPNPGTAALLGLGLLVMALGARRLQAAQAARA
jgi:hypothetical protein